VKKIVAICGAGIGSSGILKINAERCSRRLGLEADVTAAHLSSLSTDVVADAQVVLTSAEFVDAILPDQHRRDRD
jgi:PTS system ascorbate-specific IIB component